MLMGAAYEEEDSQRFDEAVFADSDEEDVDFDNEPKEMQEQGTAMASTSGQRLRTTAHSFGGLLRGDSSAALEARCGVNTKTFTHGFKGGPLMHCCAPSFGLASGLYSATWANS